MLFGNSSFKNKLLKLISILSLIYSLNGCGRETAEKGRSGSHTDKQAHSLAERLPDGWTSEDRIVNMIPSGAEKKEFKIYKNTIGMEFILIQPGKFIMGNNGGMKNQLPEHHVRITKPFYISTHEILKKTYSNVTGNNSYYAEEHFEHMSWTGAMEFCTALSEKEGIIYRLPTEAEWEYACRAGANNMYYSTQYDKRLLKSDRIDAHIDPLGVVENLVNAWGVEGMNDIIWEWCYDWYGADYYKRSLVDDPKGPDSGIERVLRGGWSDVHRDKITFPLRTGADPSDSSVYANFHVVAEK